MYRVELTEKEAKIIGEVRWGKKNRKRWLLWVGGLFIAGFVSLVITATTGAVGMGEMVGLSIAGVLFIAAYIVFMRCFYLQLKAGKAFVQSLKEEE